MIYLISFYYPPESNPPANRFGHFARILLEKYGAENVKVVTGRPNYPDGKLPNDFKWRLFKKTRGDGGESVLHLYEIPAPFRGLYRKTIGMLSFTVSVFVYFLFKRIKRDDLLIVTSGPVFPAYAIYFLSRLKKLRYMVDVRDLWPQVVAGMGFMKTNGSTYKLLMKLSDRTYKAAEGLIGNSEGISDYLTSVSPDGRIDLLYNPVDVELFKPWSEEESVLFKSSKSNVFLDENTVTFLFSGTFSNYVDLRTLMTALSVVKDKGLNFLFILIGQGEMEDELKRYVAGHNLDKNVVFLPFMERNRLVEYIRSVDVCYASLRDSEMLKYAIPTKIIEYLACDKPIIAALNGPFADILREHKAVSVIAPGDPYALAAAIVGILENRNSFVSNESLREFAVSRFSVATFKKKLLAIVDFYI